jgi:Cu/Ag efflux pump CusA
MLGGLSVSTLITLILIPTIFYMFEKRKIAKIAEKQQAGIDMESD